MQNHRAFISTFRSGKIQACCSIIIGGFYSPWWLQRQWLANFIGLASGVVYVENNIRRRIISKRIFTEHTPIIRKLKKKKSSSNAIFVRKNLARNCTYENIFNVIPKNPKMNNTDNLFRIIWICPAIYVVPFSPHFMRPDVITVIYTRWKKATSNAVTRN